MEVNNNNLPAEHKVAFNSALAKFQGLEKGKAIKKATAAVAETAVKVIKQEGPIRIHADDFEPPKAPTSSHLLYPVNNFYDSRAYKIEKESLFVHIQKDYSYLSRVDPKFQNDADLINAAKNNAIARIKEVKKGDHFYLKHYPKQLQENKELVLAVVRHYGWQLKGALAQFQEDPEVILAAKKMVMEHIRNLDSLHQVNLSRLPQQLQEDKELVLAAVRQSAMALEGVLKQFQEDPEVILAAKKGLLEFIQKISSECYLDLKKVPQQLQKDKEVVLAAVRQSAKAFVDVLEPFKDDREVVIAAVQQNSEWIRFASDKMKEDPYVKLACKYVHNK